MYKIEPGQNSSSFVINGLTYISGIYDFVYSGDGSGSTIYVGIVDIWRQQYLIPPVPLSRYVDLLNQPFANLSAFTTYVAPLIKGEVTSGPTLPFSPTLNSAIVFWMNDTSFTDGTDIVTTEGGNITVVKNALEDGLDATLVGTPGTLVTELDGNKALQFSGAGYYSFGEPEALDFVASDTFCFAAWIGDTIPVNGGALLAKAGPTIVARQYFSLYEDTAMFFQVGASNNQVTNTTVNPQDVLIWDCDGPIQYKYQNNVLLNSRAAGDTLNNIDVRLGARSADDTATGAGAFFNTGSLRQLFVFNRNITPAERLEIQNYFASL